MTTVIELARQARPRSDDDWGSDRQVAAQNLFFGEVQKVLPAGDFAALESYCLKATTDEMVDEALRYCDLNMALGEGR